MQIPKALKKPQEQVIIDFMKALLRSSKETTGKTYNIIMIIIDKLTKYAYFKPITINIIILETVKVFIE